MNSGLTGAQASNQAQMVLDRNDLPRDWGPSALNAAAPGQHFRAAMSCRSAGKRWLSNASGSRQARERLAAERDCHAAERLPVHAADRLEPLGRWRHAQSRPPFAQSGVYRTGRPRQSEPVVQSERLRPAGARDLRQPGPRRFRPGLAEMDVSLLKTTAISENVSLQFRAEFFNVLNHANFGTPNATVFSGTRSALRPA